MNQVQQDRPILQTIPLLAVKASDGQRMVPEPFSWASVQLLDAWAASEPPSLLWLPEASPWLPRSYAEPRSFHHFLLSAEDYRVTGLAHAARPAQKLTD